jgi:small-conductance mechanosensitive channel
MRFLEWTLYQNTVARWLVALAIALGATLVLVVARRIGARQLGRIASHTQTDIDDIVHKTLLRTRTLFLLITGIWIGARFVTLPAVAAGALRVLIVVAATLQLGTWLGTLLRSLLERRAQRTLQIDPAAATTLRAMGFVVSLVLWAVLGLMALQNLGVEIGPLLAGLGVGGIAVALALQNVLSDLFGSLSIVLDKPFVIGDTIVVGDLTGTVEQIGLKTTRLRSVTGELLVFSNSDLLQSRIRNFRWMYERRILFTIGVTYATPRAKLEAIPAMIRTIIEGVTTVRFDRAHFKTFSESSLDFEIVYYVKSSEYLVYMDAQQVINLAIVEKFAAEGIEFAFPTQTLLLDRTRGSGRPAGARERAGVA